MAEHVASGAAPPVESIESLVIGGGPAGLMAAEVLASAGRKVVVVDAMPSLGRKLLMAGKSGLNLTKAEDTATFLSKYTGGNAEFDRIVSNFGPEDVQEWAQGLGQTLFTGSTGRVFPTAMKASPLLRAWLERLSENDVTLRTRWRWTGWDGDDLLFATPDGTARISSSVTVLALGGASWRRLGSDGAWANALHNVGVAVMPFKPANVGFRVDWSAHMSSHYGSPVKGTSFSAGPLSSRGEWIISSKGIEGGGVYEVSAAVRDGPTLNIDLMPDLSADDVAARLSRSRGKMSMANHLRKSLGLGAAQRALLMEWGRPLPDGSALAALIKCLPVRHAGPLPIDQAISTAGGVSWDALDGLELRARRGVFVSGEMLDWEAPTGGYLLTACLATGREAGDQAAAFLARSA